MVAELCVLSPLSISINNTVDTANRLTRSVFDTLLIGGGPVAAASLCKKRGDLVLVYNFHSYSSLLLWC